MINLKIDNYKDTSQMASWRKLKLGDHIDILTGYSFKSKLFNTEGDGKPLIRNRNINNQIPDIYTTESYDQSYVVLPGDILITMDGDFNIAKWTGVESLLNQRVLKINKYDNETIVKNYLLYSLEKHLDYIHRITSGTTVKHLKKSDIENLIIPIPPIKEQEKIAEILSTVDEQIEQTEQLIEKTTELKKGLMQKLLTKGIGHTEFKQTELGEIPVEWEVIQIKDLIERSQILKHSDGNHGSLYPKANEFIAEGIPYISANSLKNGIVDLKMSKYLSVERASKFKKGVAINNDVLFAHNATVGPVGILKTKKDYVILSTSLTLFRCNPDYIKPIYLSNYLSSPVFKKQYEKVMGQTTRNQVPITTQKELYAIIPSIQEQQKIAEILTSVDEDIEGYEEEKVKYEELKKGLMQQLLTGKTRVKVD